MRAALQPCPPHRANPSATAARGRSRRLVALVTSLCLALASGLTILLPAAPAAADGTPDISLSKSAPGSVLVGEPVT